MGSPFGRNIPSDIVQFLERNVESLAALEVLLFVQRRPDAEWDSKALADLLYLDRSVTGPALESLRVRGLVTARDEPFRLYQYAPQDDATKRTLDQLATLYAERRLLVVAHIVSQQANARARAFSDAFRLRKGR